MDGENLGPTAPWQIKDFPVELRRKIIADAAAENLTVGQYLTRFFVAGAAPASPAGRQGPSTADLCNLMQAASHAATASGRPMPKRTAGRLYRFLDDNVRVAAGLPPSKPHQTPLRIGTESPTRIDSSVPDLAAAE